MPPSGIAMGHAFERGAAFNGSVDSNCSMASSPANFRKRSEIVGVGTGVAAGRKTGVVVSAAGLKSIESTPSSSSGSLDRGLQVSFFCLSLYPGSYDEYMLEYLLLLLSLDLRGEKIK